MILTPEVLTIFILNTLFLGFGIIAFILSIKIFLNWDIESTSSLQYKLEKQSFLTSTIIKYIFMIKVPLFLFFIFTLDKISNLLVGAMCAAGVVNATKYGNFLFVFKIVNLYIFAYWLSLHYEDIKYEKQPYTKLKFAIFIVIFFSFLAELILESMLFFSLEPDKMVSCCGAIFSQTATSYISNIFTIKIPFLLSAFYGNFILIILFAFFRLKYMFSLVNVLFIPVSIISIIVFFGTYIYELPTHHCPFCLLQSDYYYIGYFLYTFLFLGTFYGFVNGVINFTKDRLNINYKKSIFYNSLFVFILTLYPVVYYMKNGVFL